MQAFGAASASVWAWSLLSVTGISAIALVGGLTFLLREQVLRPVVLLLVSFAAGALLGDAFIHLIPELAEEAGFDLSLSLLILAGVGVFFVIEKVLHWHHAHLPTEEVIHPVAWTNLIGDGIHNFIDGTLVAGAFLTDTKLGIGTAIAVALHEIPQELGDMGILVHAGMSKKRALLLNLSTALVSLAGVALALLLAGAVDDLSRILLALTAGGFVYIAGSDLIPELQRETRIPTAILQLTGLSLGVGLMAALTLLE
ncbi:MAG TPA: ZIP family metal transporter [Actinomycetota bacterium]|nr:ZIP family metal transporter [Actinomycetota bacterium]